MTKYRLYIIFKQIFLTFNIIRNTNLKNDWRKNRGSIYAIRLNVYFLKGIQNFFSKFPLINLFICSTVLRKCELWYCENKLKKKARFNYCPANSIKFSITISNLNSDVHTPVLYKLTSVIDSCSRFSWIWYHVMIARNTFKTVYCRVIKIYTSQHWLVVLEGVRPMQSCRQRRVKVLRETMFTFNVWDTRDVFGKVRGTYSAGKENAMGFSSIPSVHITHIHKRLMNRANVITVFCTTWYITCVWNFDPIRAQSLDAIRKKKYGI